MTADTVGRLLRHQAAARGEHPLLVCDAERLTYREADGSRPAATDVQRQARCAPPA
ncbi:hypothetical protein [Mycolicibacterium rhodesiae]|uniref:hypothetical protein n=1 Tax=Mycolicibacterium rhodesiae TaxID=36814 RepID=UPI0013FE2A92|nr:hypothetical protein [Mycolicibacterium rhodesiae]MCV7346671.1 hypothetical protein [Mycolicibacterium rhodesiae]